ncbi:MAG TPA: nucleotidyltransferase family protein [Pyrinomonadaceae bacterium]|nr:nucleotidyltransferase family protein [Pyrinomonadaceae bacterium]
MIQQKSDLFALLSKHELELKQLGVRRLGVFGSFVSGLQNEQSDIDILVEFEKGKKSFDNFMKLASFLEQRIGRRVEVVTPESLSPHIGPYILREVEYASSSS